MKLSSYALLLSLAFASQATAVHAQLLTPTPEITEAPFEAAITAPASTAINQSLLFTSHTSILPPDVPLQETFWDFGDGVRTTGAEVRHVFRRPGTYTVTLRLSLESGERRETKTSVRVFANSLLLIADTTADSEQLRLAEQQAAENGILLHVLIAQSGGPEAVLEEELTQQLLDVRSLLMDTPVVILWTSGGVGANVLSKFAQHLRSAPDLSTTDLQLPNKGIVLLSQTSLSVLARTAQSAFDQLRPSYIILTRPEAINLLTKATHADMAREMIAASPIEHRLLGTFSQRTVSDLTPLNAMSFGLNFLVNHGVPINNIILVLMLPVIATILALARQVIGIKAFGLLTPAMTTLSFLVMGLTYGLLVFIVVLGTGTLTRLILRRLRLLYLPRMALVITSVSLAILVLLGVGVFTGQTATLSFSIFPILILTILAEEFIAVQFKHGGRLAFTATAWTLILAVGGYFIVSSELLRTLILSYPELILLAIPCNILLGRWSGLRLTEYIRFRKLLSYGRSV